MAAYLTTADVDALIGTNERQAMFSDDNTVAGYSATYFTALNTFASAIVQSAAKNAGYELGATTTDDVVKMATLGQVIAMVYGRKGLPIPSLWQPFVDMRNELLNGNLPLVAEPETITGVGGFTWSDQSETATDAKPQIFSRSKLDGY